MVAVLFWKEIVKIVTLVYVPIEGSYPFLIARPKLFGLDLYIQKDMSGIL